MTSSAEEVVNPEPPVGVGTPMRDPARISKLDTENKNGIKREMFQVQNSYIRYLPKRRF